MKTEQLKKITEELDSKIQNFQEDKEGLLKYLEFQSKFYRGRSFHNSLLIFMFKENSELVATYKQWKTIHNRIVVACIVCREFANAKCTCEEITKPQAIPQLRPIHITQDKDGNPIEKDEQFVFFRAYTVFDIEDTEPLNDKGLRVKNPNAPIILNGSDGGEVLMLASIFIEKNGWDYHLSRPIPSGANGYTRKDTKEIVIAPNPIKQQAKTTLHELAHYHLHLDDDFDYLNCRGLAEVQAESVAFTVMKFLGLDSSDYSIAYIRGWGSDDFKEFKSSLKVIVETSQKIIKDLELHEGGLDD